ncbi:MAG: phosphoenolpyruvate mutase [Clostridia bacterium]|nr:phosphoenolpyruvate mutase [Clostridia bacterium]
MKALILNSGMGTRMGVLTSEQPKCMTEIGGGDTILSRELKMLADFGIEEAVITTGYLDNVLMEYALSLDLPVKLTFVKNPDYAKTNYIYSIYLAEKELRGEDILLFHGDMVFENSILQAVMEAETSVMCVSGSVPLPEKDFKAVISEDGRIINVGVAMLDQKQVAAQPLYKLTKEDFGKWLDEICAFVANNDVKCYAENAFNKISGSLDLRPFDYGDMLCSEIDTAEDLATVSARLKEVQNRTVYMCFASDLLHGGHISIIRKAARLGKLIIGVLSDRAVVSYRRYPLVPESERMNLIRSINGVHKVVLQKDLSYRENLLLYKPDIVVHGDDWVTGFQKPVRDEVIEVLGSYGGKLVEFPYSKDTKYAKIESSSRETLSMPDMRRKRLRRLLEMKPLVTAIEAHSGITGLIAENTTVYEDGKAYQFDAMWVSSLCDSTAKGKPDIELVDMTSRLRTVDDIMEVTTKPIILDGDTGGLAEHFVYNVRTLERLGVSAVIIEDKTGLKKNSLFGTEVVQTQDSIENFCAKIRAGRAARKTEDFMIIARIESLILEKGMEDALTRAFAYVEAGADGIMIHSRKKDPSEIFEFIRLFREKDSTTPIVLVPTSFNSVTEEEFRKAGANIVIYANHLTRSGFPAMKKTAETILKNHRSLEADQYCMPIKEIISLIPEE